MDQQVTHFIEEHVDAHGIPWNKNTAEEAAVDYSTVDCPFVHLVDAAEVLEEKYPQLSKEILRLAFRHGEHLYQRGFDFPTEGEACTEDGSIACTAWGLTYLYNHLANAPSDWLRLALELMDFHRKLEMNGLDSRVHGSSLRFWQTHAPSGSIQFP